jgi:hypothetical protein
MSMKKMFKVFALLVGLVLIAVPSHALIGIDDAVPGHDIIVPFIVEMGATGLDTLVMVQEISDNAGLGGTEAKAVGQLHWYLFDVNSVERASRIVRYSGGDVVPISLRDLILNVVPAGNLPALEYDLDGDGTNDSYVGYIYFDNIPGVAGVVNNLVAYFHYADLLAGRACGAYAAMKEQIGDRFTLPIAVPTAGGQVQPNFPLGISAPPPLAPTANILNSVNTLGYNYCQFATANPVGAGSEPLFLAGANTSPQHFLLDPQVFEAFSPAAYFWSAWRQRNAGFNPLWFNDYFIQTQQAALNFIRFTPRFYLYDANGETYIILWKNRNHNQVGVNNRVSIFVWNESEVRINTSITLPDELNIIRVRDLLPPDFLAAYPSAGWVDIVIAGNAGVPDPIVGPTAGYLQNWRYTEFLMWTWMFAGDASASLNWASLWTDRQVGTLGQAPRPTN